jgi:predicted HD superfamily hydrolase involved in NAD metabolism
VAYTAMCLAMRYGYPIDKAEVAGLLHDSAKRYPEAKIIEKCAKHGIGLTKEELLSPAVIHAKYGVRIARDKFGVTDPEILDAIRYHTTGRRGMGLAEKILYVADAIEPTRGRSRELESMRRMAFVNLDEAIAMALKDTLEYLTKSGYPIHPDTKDAFAAYSIFLDGKQPVCGQAYGQVEEQGKETKWKKRNSSSGWRAKHWKTKKQRTSV